MKPQQSFLAIALFVSTSIAGFGNSASAQDRRVRLQMLRTALPAGEYIVARSTQGSEGLVIRARDGKGGVYLLTKSIQTRDNQVQTRVVFNRYNDQYFLSQVWISGRSTGRELHKSRQERALERELAARAAKPESIAVAGKAR